MKKKRQSEILDIISREVVETQEELSERLKGLGFEVTQATVSRDIRDLNLIKIPAGGGRRRYAASVSRNQNYSEKYARVLKEGTESISTASQLLVIKTVSGMAMAVAAALDELSLPEIVGSIAGDDTIFCAVRSKNDADAVLKKIKEML
ncbi:MAG: arginine repressor [Lachnospiraceae bacterium]|nr:arginine repressor [Lachnospiraceae bacterium]